MTPVDLKALTRRRTVLRSRIAWRRACILRLRCEVAQLEVELLQSSAALAAALAAEKGRTEDA